MKLENFQHNKIAELAKNGGSIKMAELLGGPQDVITTTTHPLDETTGMEEHAAGMESGNTRSGILTRIGRPYGR